MSPAQSGVARSAVPASLASVFALRRSSHRAAAVPLFVALTVAGSYVALPLPGTPVPVTLQTLFVVLAGVLLGPWMGASAMAAYLALGAAGAPVFAGGGAGLAWLMGPTGGYLVAFPAAAFVAGWIAAPSHGVLRLSVALSLGTALVLLGGVTQLAFLTQSNLGAAASLGVVPFLPGAVAKVILGVGLVRLTARDRPADT